MPQRSIGRVKAERAAREFHASEKPGEAGSFGEAAKSAAAGTFNKTALFGFGANGPLEKIEQNTRQLVELFRNPMRGCGTRGIGELGVRGGVGLGRMRLRMRMDGRTVLFGVVCAVPAAVLFLIEGPGMRRWGAVRKRMRHVGGVLEVSFCGLLLPMLTVGSFAWSLLDGSLSTRACNVLLVVSALLMVIVVCWPQMRIPVLARRRSLTFGRIASCPNCCYSLTGNTSGTCPECGMAVPASVAAEAKRTGQA